MTFPNLLWAPKSLTWEGPSKEEGLIISVQDSCSLQSGVHPAHHIPACAQTRKCSPMFLWNFTAYGCQLTCPLNPQQSLSEMKKLTKSSEWETCSRSQRVSGVAWITIHRWLYPSSSQLLTWDQSCTRMGTWVCNEEKEGEECGKL